MGNNPCERSASHVNLPQNFSLSPIHHDSLAQLVEHNTFNVGVLGSSPRRITKVSELSEQNAETLTVSAFFVVSPPGRIRHFSALCREFCVSRRIVSRKTHDCESIVSHATHIAVSPLKMCVLRHSARTPLGYEGSRCQRWIPVSTTNRPYS